MAARTRSSVAVSLRWRPCASRACSAACRRVSVSSSAWPSAAHPGATSAHCSALFTGDRVAVLRAYERCRWLLSDEPGIAPAAATEDLHGALREGR